MAPGPLAQKLENGILTTRYLRVATTDEEEDEERGISAKIPGLEKISSALKSSKTKTKELQALLKADESLGKAFKTVKLSTMPIGKDDFIETNMVVKFFSSPNFKAWSNHAAKTNPQSPQGTMLTALTNVLERKTSRR